MSQTLKAIGVRDFMSKYSTDETVFDILPEFNFLKSVSQKAKDRKCNCGLGQEINEGIQQFNTAVLTLNPDTLEKVKQVFDLEKPCFAVQTSSSYEVRCY